MPRTPDVSRRRTVAPRGFVAARSRLRSMTAVGLLAFFALGCQGRGDMTGKVSYKGKPVPFGTVLVQSNDGSSHQANIEPDGTYSIQGVLVGTVRVAVNSP